MVFTSDDSARVLELARKLVATTFLDGVKKWEPVWPENDAMEQRLQSYGAKHGKLSCSITWNTTCNIGLVCTTPSGQKIFFGSRKSSASGGTMDVGNQNRFVSESTSTPAENIVFDNPRPGRYVFEVWCNSKRVKERDPPNAVKVRLRKLGAPWEDKMLPSLGSNEKKTVFVTQWGPTDEARASAVIAGAPNDYLLSKDLMQSIEAQAEAYFNPAESSLVDAVNQLLQEEWQVHENDFPAPPPELPDQSLVSEAHMLQARNRTFVAPQSIALTSGGTATSTGDADTQSQVQQAAASCGRTHETHDTSVSDDPGIADPATEAGVSSIPASRQEPVEAPSSAGTSIEGANSALGQYGQLLPTPQAATDKPPDTLTAAVQGHGVLGFTKASFTEAAQQFLCELANDAAEMLMERLNDQLLAVQQGPWPNKARCDVEASKVSAPNERPRELETSNAEAVGTVTACHEAPEDSHHPDHGDVACNQYGACDREEATPQSQSNNRSIEDHFQTIQHRRQVDRNRAPQGLTVVGCGARTRNPRSRPRNQYGESEDEQHERLYACTIL